MEGLTYMNPSVSYSDINTVGGGSEFTNSHHYNYHWIDYLIFGSAFILPPLISIFFGFVDRHEKSSENFLMGNRQVSCIPIGLALFSSFVSGVTILENPVEIYLFGTQLAIVVLTLLPIALIFTRLYLPVYFNMELQSPFEYFRRRFTRTTQTFVSTISLAQNMVYVSLVVYYVSTVFSTVIDVDAKILVVVIFILSAFSNYVGGYKSIVWTNALQVLIVIASILTIVVIGIMSTGDINIQFDKLLDGNRLEFLNFDPDPRSRHTFWTSSIGTYFIWISFYAASQSQIQRIISLPNLKLAKRAIYFNIFLLILLLSLTFILGMLIYTNYYGCDPIKIGKIKNYSLLVPYYAEELFKNKKGLIGFFLAGLLCATMSNVSSCLNSMSSLITYNYYKHWIPNVTEESLIFLSKITNVLLGGLAVALVMVAQNIDQFLPMLWRILGMVYGPIFGVFTLGMFFPWANSKGSLLGMITTLGFLSCAIVFSSMSENVNNGRILPSQRLPLNISESCITEEKINSHFTLEYVQETSQPRHLPWIPTVSSTIQPSGTHITVFDDFVSMSYVWYPGLGCVLTIVLGLIFSILFLKFHKKRTVSPECFSPSILKIWLKWFPSHMSTLVEPDENLMLLSSSVFAFLPRTLEKIDEKMQTNCDVEITPIY